MLVQAIRPTPNDAGPLAKAISESLGVDDLHTPWCIHVLATQRIADHIATSIDEIHQIEALGGTFGSRGPATGTEVI